MSPSSCRSDTRRRCGRPAATRVRTGRDDMSSRIQTHRMPGDLTSEWDPSLVRQAANENRGGDTRPHRIAAQFGEKPDAALSTSTSARSCSRHLTGSPANGAYPSWVDRTHSWPLSPTVRSSNCSAPTPFSDGWRCQISRNDLCTAGPRGDASKCGIHCGFPNQTSPLNV